LYSAVKLRRRGLSGSRGASSLTASSWASRIVVVGIIVVGMVISVYLLRSRPEGLVSYCRCLTPA